MQHIAQRTPAHDLVTPVVRPNLSDLRTHVSTIMLVLLVAAVWSIILFEAFIALR